jgi:ABC-type dipeptide/oligopeptide/nickel transport system permease component
LGTASDQNGVVLSVSGMCLLLATKFADALTTGIGLAYVPGIYESNPVVRPVFEEVGVTDGLLFSSFAIVAGIVAVTEIAAIAIARRRREGHLAPVVRAVGYGIPSLLFAAVAVRNAAVLLEAIEAAAVV